MFSLSPETWMLAAQMQLCGVLAVAVNRRNCRRHVSGASF